MKKHIRFLVTLTSVVALTVMLAACGSSGGGSGGGDTAPATVVVSSSDAGGAFSASSSGFVSQIIGSRADVDSDLIVSLTIDVVKITVHHAGSDDDGDDDDGDDGEPEPTDDDPDDDDDGEPSSGGWITLFEADADTPVFSLDLIQLQTFSEVMTSANLPVGKYTKIVLYYENPSLILDDDDDTDTPPIESTDIQMTANGRLFVSQNFELEADEPVLLVFDFSSVGLSDTNGGSYVLTPQLRVDIDIQSAEAEIEGEIVEITEEPQGIAVDNGEVIIDVVITAETVIYREAPEVETARTEGEQEGGIPMTFEELMLGDIVEVEGLLQVDGSIVADEVEVEDEEEEPED